MKIEPGDSLGKRYELKMKKLNYTLILSFLLLCSFSITSCHSHKEGDSHEKTEHHHEDDDDEHDHDHEEDDDDHDHDHDHDHDKAGSHEHEGHNHDEDGLIHLSTKQAARVGVEVDTLRRGTFHSVLHVGGKLLTTNSDESVVVANSTGVATLSSATEGSYISAGTLLASISSDALEGGCSFAKSEAEYEAAKKEYERAQALLKDGVISQKRFDEAKLAYQQAKIAYQSQSSHAGSSGIKVVAKTSGYLKQWMIKQGEYVSVGQSIAVVSKNNRLQLVADVPACGFQQLRSFRSANFIPSYGSETYSLDEMNGKLLSYGKSSSSSSFVPVSFEFDNKGNFLSDSYVEVFLLGAEEKNVLSIPLTAVTEEQGLHFVYIQECIGLYRKMPVKLGESDGIRIRVLSGLKEGDCLVVKGAYQVKLASMSSAIPEGHSHNH